MKVNFLDEYKLMNAVNRIYVIEFYVDTEMTVKIFLLYETAGLDYPNKIKATNGSRNISEH